MIAWYWWVLAYVAIGIGTWRWAFSELYVTEVESLLKRLAITRADAEQRAAAEPHVWATSTIMGLIWPVLLFAVVCWAVLVWPFKMVSPYLGKWFMAPARRKAARLGVST